jgi:predicted small lipoprotein YifL
LSPRSGRFAFRLAVLGVLIAALGLAGCGRKGPLDPPPAAVAAPAPAGATPDAKPGPADGFDEQGRPVAPQSAQKRTILDWLLN